MVKKSNTKRKGISKGLPRGLGASRRQNQENGWLASIITTFCPLQNFTQFTEFVFNTFVRATVAFHIVPLVQTAEGHYNDPTGLRILPFRLYKILTLLIVVHRLGVSLTLAKNEEITPPLLLAVAASITLASVWIISEWDPVEAEFIARNSGSLLEDLSRERSRNFGLFDPAVICVKVVGVVLLIPGCALCFALTNGLLYMGLPTSWCRLALSDGWLTVESKDVIWWLIVFLPLELASVLGPLMTAAYVCVMGLIGQQAIKTYGENIRRINVIDLKSRAEVEQMYIRWQIYMRASNDLTKVALIPAILGVAGAITMTLFLTIRFTDVPIYIYILFPLLAFTLLFFMAITLYELVNVTEISQQVLAGQLLSFQNSMKLRLLSREQRKLVLLRAKAFKPIDFSLGPFTIVTYAVMAGIWDEMLNQLLFFLSF